MGRVIRSVLAVFAGLVAGTVAIMVLETAGHLIFPPPAGIDPQRPETIAAAMKTMPVAALAVVVAAWGAGAFVGSWVAARLARGSKVGHGMAVGGLFLALTLANLSMIPHPAWMWALGLAEILPAAYLGARLASPRGGAAQPRTAVEPA